MYSPRNHGLDFGRAFAILVVVFGHAQFEVDHTTAIDVLARFAVPFFFMLSGYFLKQSAMPLPKVVLRLAAAYLVPFAVWLAVYLLWFRPSPEAFASPIFLAKLLIQGGPAHHLWFLPSLTLSLAMFVALLRLRPPPIAIAAIAAAFYATGLVFGPYHDVLFASGGFFWNMRNGPFFGFPFIALGWLIALYRVKPSLRMSFALLAFGAAFNAGEILTLDSYHLHFEHDLMIGTIPFALGFFFVSLSLPSARPVRLLASLGPFSLGIYCVHLLVIEVLRSMIGEAAARENVFALGFVAALGSILFCLAVSRIPGAAWLVCSGRRRPTATSPRALRPL